MMPSREDWLGRMVDALRPAFAEHGHPLPERIRVSCGWPSRSALSGKAQRIGEAWSQLCSADGAHETFLSPVLADPVDVGAVLVHELVHHAVGVQAGHKGPFRTLALAVGLTGPMRATTAGAALRVRLHALAEAIGPYPHATLSGGNGKKKQSTRMLKVTCPECGCIARMTRQWLEEVGAPTCACGGTMTEGGES
ncbi:MAG: transcription elongation protein SprT [Planctomycetes bacterium]|nr:transcription elongation protein SprT [Planctomycetota bacterium]